MLDEKDKFLLSEKNTLDLGLRKDNGEKEARVKLPARYEIIDRVQKWGVDIKDPLAVRQLSEAEDSDQEIIMTTKNPSEKTQKRREIAIKQIEKRF